jgi:hypothetical protein
VEIVVDMDYKTWTALSIVMSSLIGAAALVGRHMAREKREREEQD